MDALAATVVSIVFETEDSDYRIIRVSDQKKRTQTVLGEFPKPTIGVTYQFEGKWVDNAKYGKQFSAETIAFVAPVGEQSTKDFLIRVGKMPGGPIKKLLAECGSQDPLPAIQALTVADWVRITGANEERCIEWRTKLHAFLGIEKIVAKICELVSGCHIPQASIIEVAKRWGGVAEEQIRRNAFRMMAFSGVGFARADAVYLKHGGSKMRLKRHALAILTAIEESESTWLATTKAIEAASKLLGVPFNERAITLAIRAKLLREWNEDVTTVARDRAETSIANKMWRASRCDGIELGELPGLSEHQLEQVRISISRRVGCLVGGPGTGKTYCAAAIIRWFLESIHAEQVGIVAPTGKAAVRLTETMSAAGLEVQAKTIHSFCGVKSIRSDGEIVLDDEPVDVKLLVVDESSMIPTALMSSMLRVIPDDCQVLFLGDTGQLPPIGHGAPLRDFVACGQIPVGRLVEVRRNSGAIVRVCSEIAGASRYTPSNKVHESIGENAIHCERQSDRIIDVIEEVFRNPPPGISSGQIQVLSPLKKKEVNTGTHVINQRIRRIVNPSAEGPISVGDKVYVRQNTTESMVEKTDGKWTETGTSFVANGEFGRVLDVVPKQEGQDGGLVVELEAPLRRVLIPKISMLEFGWATTVHKSQGSEWPIVITVCDKASTVLGSKQLIYTAISRAKRLSVTVGQKSVVDRYCSTDVIRYRRTMFCEKIRELERKAKARNENSNESDPWNIVTTDDGERVPF